MMTTPLGQQMVDAFRYVRDVHRNCARMLRSCDPYLQDRGYRCRNWASISGCESQIAAYDTWLHGYMIRQYSPWTNPSSAVPEIFTVGAIPWRAENPDAFEPVCIASRLWANTTPNDIYWIGIIQMYENNITSNEEPRELDSTFLSDSSRKAKFLGIVNGGRILSIAVPLLELTHSNQVLDRVINPLLDHPFWSI